MTSSACKISQMSKIVRDLYAVTERLRTLFPDKKFPLDGRLVGDLGEVVAECLYDFKSLPGNTRLVDGVICKSKVGIQVKATQGEREIRLSGPCEKLLVFRMHQDGSFEELYNGNGDRVWHACQQRKPSGRQYPISLGQLRELQKKIAEGEEVQKNGR